MNIRRDALKITGLYAIFAALWILFSDRLLAELAPSPQVLSQLQTVKGLIFVLVTAALLYLLVERKLGQLDASLTELQRSEQYLRTLLETIPHGIEELDAGGRISYGNPARHRMLGYAPGELLGKMIWELAPPAEREALKRYFEYLVAEQPAPVPYLGETLRKDGTPIKTQVDWTYKRGAAGELLGFIAVITDVTERERDREQLRRARERAQGYLDVAGVMLVALNAHGEIMLINRKGCSVLGYEERELLGQSWFERCLPNEIRDATHATFQSLIMGRIEGLEYHENPVLTRGGERRLIAWHNTVLHDEQGRIIGTLSSGEDITERRQAEEALLRRAKELRILNEAGLAASTSLSLGQLAVNIRQSLLRLVEPDMVLFFVREGAALHLQDAHPEDADFRAKAAALQVDQCLCGMAAGEGRPVFSNDIDADRRCTLMACRDLGMRAFVALPLPSAEGVVGVVGLAWRQPQNFSGQETFFEALCNTIASGVQNARLYSAELNHAIELERKVAERTRDLSQANERLKELDRLKSMFIASMSHELRTPLNSIIGFSGVLLQGMSGELNERQHDQLRRVQSAGQHLLALITDVIDISKIEAGKVEPEPQSFMLDALINEAVGQVRMQIEEKGLALELAVPEGIAMHTDRRRLLQCLLNYLSNAIKFTEHGQIGISAERIDGTVRIDVSDSGIGIAEQDQPRLFQPFVRLESPLSARTPGTGLGLYLTHKLAGGVLGGAVAVRSRLGEGSVFSLTVPVELAGRGAGAAGRPAP